MSDGRSGCVHRQVCPVWCTRTTCLTSTGVVWHTGAGLSWSTPHVSFEMGLLRRDGAGCPGVARTEVSVRLTTPGVEDGAHIEVPPGEARMIARRLIALADLADATVVSRRRRW
jgi:hypothetical protein